MQVFKFGGASVKDAQGVINLSHIISLNRDEQLIIVVSAMGKMTNALELLTNAYFQNAKNLHQLFNDIKQFHNQILIELFGSENHKVFDEIANT